MNTIRIVATYANGSVREVTYEVASRDILTDLFVTVREQAWSKGIYAAPEEKGT